MRQGEVGGSREAGEVPKRERKAHWDYWYPSSIPPLFDGNPSTNSYFQSRVGGMEAETQN